MLKSLVPFCKFVKKKGLNGSKVTDKILSIIRDKMTILMTIGNRKIVCLVRDRHLCQIRIKSKPKGPAVDERPWCRCNGRKM